MRYYYKTLDGKGLLNLKQPLDDLTGYVEITEIEYETLTNRSEKTPEQKAIRELHRQIAQLKHQLRASDYKAIKFAEGLISTEDYEPIKQSRENIRKLIRELEGK